MIVFDMDGVLVDVSDSYRETICQTVEHFSGTPVTREQVQEYKNRGGFNNDWLLSQTMCRDLGCDVAYDTVAEYFNSIFYGGLMMRERWIPRDGLLDSLAARHALAIFTGRPREEALITLRRFATEKTFDPLIGHEDVVHGKPHPEGLLKIRQSHPDVQLVYVGDTVDDARSARAAGVPFIGVAHSGVHQRSRLLDLFQTEDAIAVIENVNELSRTDFSLSVKRNPS
jgi:HAD superfamily phosphatase